MWVRTGLLAVALGGCTTSFDKVRETVASAPEWYGDARTEVRGEGYPRIGRVTVLADGDTRPDDMQSVTADLSAYEMLFRMNPRAVPPRLELERMRSWAQAARASAEALDTPGDFLTDADIEALRAVFQTDRALPGGKAEG